MIESDSDTVRRIHVRQFSSFSRRDQLTSVTNLVWTYFMRGWKSATRSY